LDQVATAFFLQNFDLKKAFTMFDVNGDGLINRSEFRTGFNSLEIGLNHDEIDDLMRMMSSRPDG
jgi:Ca2+-binding EF-hand superfamily protein